MPLPVGVLRPTALLVALIGVLALVGVALRSEAVAQTNNVTVEITRVAVDERLPLDRYSQTGPFQQNNYGIILRPNDLTISGAARVRIAFSETVSSFALANLTTTNATPSNPQVETANRRWTFDVTPTADGAVSISIAAGAVNAAADATRGNASAQLSMTAALAAPKVVWTDFTSATTRLQRTGPYSAGTQIDLKVIFSENVTVSGVPTVGLHTPSKTPGSKTYNASYHSGSGTSVLLFRYTVPSGQSWLAGRTTINSSAISLPSSTSIADASGNAATLTLPPRVIKVERHLPAPAPGERAPAGVVGDSHDWVITFSEPVTVTQAPGAAAPFFQVGFTLQTPISPTNTRGNAPANYLEGSGTNKLTFRYTVRAADNVATDSSFVADSYPYVRVPDGAGVRNAAGIDVHGRVREVVNLITGREGTRFGRTLRLSFSSIHDITVHLTSSDPARATIAPSSLTILSSNTDSDHWSTGEPFIVTLHRDDDEDDNEVTISYRFESDLTIVDGRTGTYFKFLILEAPVRAPTEVPSVTRSEGTRFTISFALTESFEQDVIVHLSSSPPGRMTFEPSSVRFFGSNTDPDHWMIPQTVTVALLPDSDAEDDEVMVLYSYESVDPSVHETAGTLATYTAADSSNADYPAASLPADLRLELELVEDSDQIVPPGGERTVAVKLIYSGDYVPLQVSADSWLRIAGDVEWEDRDRRRLGLAQQETQYLGSAPPCKSRTIFTRVRGLATDEIVSWSCDLALDGARFVIPPGTPDGTFTISGSVTINGDEYTAQLEVTVGTVVELDSVKLDFATDIAPGDSTDTPTRNDPDDDQPYPDAIAVGESTTLQLAVLNEHGKASHAGEISSLVFIASRGTLSLANPAGDCVGGGGSTCQVPLDLLTADNTDQVRVTLTHPGLEQLGAAVVSASVVSTDSEAFNSNSLTVILLGPAESIAIGEPATAVLNYDPPDPEGGAEDTRDLLKLSVIASDVNDRTVPLTEPFGRVVVRNPDGRVVWSGSSYEVQNGMRLDWPLRERDDDGAPVDGDSRTGGIQPKYIRDAAGNLQVQIDIEADEAAQLTKGEYTIELRAIGETAEQTFSVGGEPAQVALSEPAGSTAEGGRLTITATVTDADGNPVGDGTPVSWEEGGTTSQVVLVQLSTEARTSGGSASATYLVVGRGTAWVRASSGDATNTRAMFNLGAAPAPTNPAEQLSSRRPGAFAAWLGVGATSASALLAGLDGIDSIAVWRGGAWLRYEVVDGAAAGGAVDFEVRRGEILRLGG